MSFHKKSLIERMGGIEAASGLLISAVELFYHKLMADTRLATFFEGKDVEMLKRKQVDFLAYVFGGPESYQGKGIAEAHEHLIREQGTFLFVCVRVLLLVHSHHRTSCPHLPLQA